ncbi:hypothetical protein NFJ02_41g108130 [Pycnococcus provasolii]
MTNAVRWRKGTARDPYEADLLLSTATIMIAGGHSLRAPWVPGSHIIDLGADAASREPVTGALPLADGAELRALVQREFAAQLPGAPGEDSWIPASDVVASDLQDVPELADDDICCTLCDLPDAVHG